MEVQGYRSPRVRNCWTIQAKECYNRGCNCQGCNMQDFKFSSKNQKCRMKCTVIELVRTIGIPEDEECQKPMIID